MLICVFVMHAWVTLFLRKLTASRSRAHVCMSPHGKRGKVHERQVLVGVGALQEGLASCFWPASGRRGKDTHFSEMIPLWK